MESIHYESKYLANLEDWIETIDWDIAWVGFWSLCPCTPGFGSSCKAALWPFCGKDKEPLKDSSCSVSMTAPVLIRSLFSLKTEALES